MTTAPDATPAGAALRDRFEPPLAARWSVLLGAGADPEALTGAGEASWEAMGRFTAPVAEPRELDVEVEDLQVPGVRGPVPVRVYRPRGIAARVGLVWLHGGAFMFGDLDMPEAHVVAGEVAQRAGAVVVSVDYRLVGPDLHYPAGQDDVRAVWAWATGADGPLGAGPPWAVGGASAGANLAVGTAQRLRDEARAGSPVPEAAGLLPIYPLVHRVVPQGDAHWAADMALLPEPLLFPPDFFAMVAAAYEGDGAQGLTYAYPGDGDLTGLGSALVVTAEFDPLRPSGEVLARDLAAAGGRVEHLTEPGVPHGHLNVPGLQATEHTLGAMSEFLVTLRS